MFRMTQTPKADTKSSIVKECRITKKNNKTPDGGTCLSMSHLYRKVGPTSPADHRTVTGRLEAVS